MKKPNDYQYSMIFPVMGFWETGKSNIVERFIKNTFSIIYNQGTEDFEKIIKVYDKKVKCLVFDFRPHEKYNQINIETFSRCKSAGFIICYDITCRDSFEYAKNQIQLIKDQNKDKIITLVGNKVDLHQKRCVETSEAHQYSQEQGIGFMEVSAKTGMNVNLIFKQMVAEFIEISINQCWAPKI